MPDTVTCRGASPLKQPTNTRSSPHETTSGGPIGAIQIEGGHDIVIENCNISDWGWRNPETGYGRNYDSAVFSRSSKLERLIIQRCKMHHPRWTWSPCDARFRHDTAGPQCITLFDTKGNHVIRYNECWSDLEQMVAEKCPDNGTIVILSTIPPKHGQAEKAAVFAEEVRRIARNLNIPLTDYHAEILRRRPHDWDGAMEKFSRYEGYDVPTLISRDGVHPSSSS